MAGLNRRRVLITGAAGQVGSALRQVCEAAGDEVLAAGSGQLDITSRDAVLAAVTGWAPHAVVNAAAWTAVDACESDPERAFRVNGLAPRWLAEACRRTGAHLVHLSTDYVFDGSSPRPYHEWDATNPLNVYGASKLAGEREVLEAGIGATVVRTSWVCGTAGGNIVKTALGLLGGDGPLRFVTDQRGCPTFADDLAPLLRYVAVSRFPGLVHATNVGAVSWYEFVRGVAEAAGHDPGRVQPITSDQLVPARPARRPANSVLDHAVARAAGLPGLPPWQDGLARLVRALGADAS